MRSRCKHPYVVGFHNYGGRGIKFCERWNLFENFLADMGERPSDDHQIERKDNDGNYEPSNCIWATRKAQGRNRRTNHHLTIDGETKTVIEWAESPIAKATYSSILERLKRGWPAKEAVTLLRQRSGTKPEGARLYTPKDEA